MWTPKPNKLNEEKTMEDIEQILKGMTKEQVKDIINLLYGDCLYFYEEQRIEEFKQTREQYNATWKYYERMQE